MLWSDMVSCRSNVGISVVRLLNMDLGSCSSWHPDTHSLSTLCYIISKEKVLRFHHLDWLEALGATKIDLGLSSYHTLDSAYSIVPSDDFWILCAHRLPLHNSQYCTLATLSMDWTLSFDWYISMLLSWWRWHFGICLRGALGAC